MVLKFGSVEISIHQLLPAAHAHEKLTVYPVLPQAGRLRVKLLGEVQPLHAGTLNDWPVVWLLPFQIRQ